jgi:hypothetical protein
VQAGHAAGGGEDVADRSCQGVANTQPRTPLVVVDVPHRLPRVSHDVILPERADTAPSM